MSANIQTSEGNRTMMKLGGVLGELPIEKAFDLARSYHIDRKKQADKTMTPIEQQKMAGLYAHVIHGNWSDPKNVNRRRQHAKTTLGKEWEGLDNSDKEQTMAAYIIMVDQIHKGFTGHVKIRVKRIKDKEAKRKLAAAVEKVKENGNKPKKESSAPAKDNFPTLMHVRLVPKGMDGPPKKKEPSEDDLVGVVAKPRTVPDIKPASEKAPTAEAEEDSGDSGGVSSQEMGAGQSAGGSGSADAPENEEFDAAQPSGSGANSEKDDDSSNEDNNEPIDVETVEEVPKEKHEAGTQTCDCCFVKAEKRMLLAKKRIARKQRKPKPIMVDRCTQTYASVYPQYIFELRRHFIYNTAADVRYLLDTILGSDADEKYAMAKELFISELRSGELKVTPNFTASMFAMIVVMNRQSITATKKLYEDIDVTYEEIKMYVREVHHREPFLVKVEFIVGVYQACKKFSSQLSGPLNKAINDYIGLRDAVYSDDEDEEIDVVNVDMTDAQKLAKAAKNAKKKASKKKAKKRNADVELCLERLNKDIQRLREIYAKENADKIARGELPADPVEDCLKHHRSKHSPQDCDDAIEYFGNKVWEMYKAMTPNYWTTEDILKWCEEKIAMNAPV